MKTLIRFLPFLLILPSCHNPPKLKLSDLKFADFEKEAIARNKVDTMFMISENNEHKPCGFDTFGFHIYDKDGNVIEDTLNTVVGQHGVYRYDNKGWIQIREKYFEYDSEFLAARYKCIPDSFLLYRYWIAKGGDTGRALYTFRFKFAHGGRLIEQTYYGENPHFDDGERIVYEYNPANKLIKTKKFFVLSPLTLHHYREAGREPITEEMTDFFYSGDALDSTIMVSYCPKNPERNFTTKTYYKSDGLKYKQVVKDSMETDYCYTRRRD